jgi:hypothetical protein
MSIVTIRLSRYHAELLLRAYEASPISSNVVGQELQRALTSRPKSSAKKKADAKRRTKAQETRAIRAKVFARSTFGCEFGCGAGATDLHHVFGRVRVKQSVETCLAVCRGCHWKITENNPSAAYWWSRAVGVLAALGYTESANRAQARLDALRLSRGQP